MSAARSVPTSKAPDVIAVVDGGTAARELASLAALKGMKVHLLCDGDTGPVEESIRASLDAKVARWTISAAEAKSLLARIAFHDAVEAVDAGLVVDFRACTEKDGAAWCARLDSLFPSSAVIAVQLGGRSFAELAGGGDRFAAVRFFPPVWDVKTVEVLSNGVSDAGRGTVLAFAAKLGKRVVPVSDVPGAVALRPYLALLDACLEVAASGAVSLDEADAAVKEALRMKVGPVELARIIGPDVVKRWCESLGDGFGAHPLLDELERGGKDDERGGKA